MNIDEAIEHMREAVRNSLKANAKVDALYAIVDGILKKENLPRDHFDEEIEMKYQTFLQERLEFLEASHPNVAALLDDRPLKDLEAVDIEFLRKIRRIGE